MNIFEIQIPVIPKCFESISGFLSQWQLPMKVPWKSQLNISKNSIEYNFGCIKTVFGGSTPLLKNILTTIFTIFVCYCSSTNRNWIQIGKPVQLAVAPAPRQLQYYLLLLCKIHQILQNRDISYHAALLLLLISICERKHRREQVEMQVVNEIK